MARNFNGVNGYLEYGSAPVTAPPMTLACWAFCSALPTATKFLISLSLGTGGGSNSSFGLMIRGGVAGKPIGAFSDNAATSATASSSAGPSANMWFHAAAVIAGTASRAAYLGGTNKGTDATSITNPAGIDTTNIGVIYFTGGKQDFFAGLIAEATLWNAALVDEEIAALATGVRPHKVRPGNLVGYWPLFGLASPEPDLSGLGQSMTLGGGAGAPSAANHAPLTPFTPKARTQPLLAAAASGILLPQVRVVRPPLHPAYLE